MAPAELTPRTIRTVKSTAPILREQGLHVTRRMYEIMFQDEHIRSMFNQAHHGQEGTQPRALAGAVHAYADNIDRLDELGPMIERIAQKHVALNVLPEHYPHVGRSLVGALHDVLGQAATGEVMKAWMEAYDFLADVLIAREAEIYRQHSDEPGGWVGWREFTVDRVAPESETIRSLYLVPSDGGQVMSFKPGQYLTFQFDVPGHGPIVRNYSISSAPGRDHYRITVKQEGPTDEAPYAPPGLGSTFLHEDTSDGDTLRVSAPAGDFFLHDETASPAVLISGGVGLTPLLSMLESLADRGMPRQTWYVHAALSGRQHAMKQHVKDIAAAHSALSSAVFYEYPTDEDVPGQDYDVAGRITMDWLKGAVPLGEADFYFCGPRGLMRMLVIGLRALDVPDERIHFEFFGPAEALYA